MTSVPVFRVAPEKLDGVRILTDPFLRSSLGPLERHGPVPTPESLGQVDIVLISHGHPDHFDQASLRSIPGRPTAVVKPRTTWSRKVL